MSDYELKLWVDDVRSPPDESWNWAKTSREAIVILMGLNAEVVLRSISLDHDLGDNDTTRPVVIWMIENDFRFNNYFVHSANPVGSEWLRGMIERYLK